MTNYERAIKAAEGQLVKVPSVPFGWDADLSVICVMCLGTTSDEYVVLEHYKDKGGNME